MSYELPDLPDPLLPDPLPDTVEGWDRLSEMLQAFIDCTEGKRLDGGRLTAREFGNLSRLYAAAAAVAAERELLVDALKEVGMW